MVTIHGIYTRKESTLTPILNTVLLLISILGTLSNPYIRDIVRKVSLI